MRRRHWAGVAGTAAALVLIAVAAQATDRMAVPAAKAGDLAVTDAWARAMLPGQPTGGGYFTVENHGQSADRLLSASSPAAGKVEFHEMKMQDSIMVMRPVQGGLEIPAGGALALKPGGYHMMFIEVKAPFKAGESVAVTLQFQNAGKLELELPVRPAGAADDHEGHGG